MKAFNNNLIVRLKTEQKKTATGLIVASNTEDPTLQGEVISVGEGRYDDNGNLIPTRIKEGDTVIFIIHMAVKTNVNGQEVVIVNEDQVLATI